MIRFLVDEDFNNDILRGLRRRLPDVDAPRIQALGLAGVSDETKRCSPTPHPKVASC